MGVGLPRAKVHMGTFTIDTDNPSIDMIAGSIVVEKSAKPVPSRL